MRKVRLVFGFVFLLSMFMVSASFFPMTGKVVDNDCYKKCISEKCDSYSRALVKQVCQNRNKEGCNDECAVAEDSSFGSSALVNPQIDGENETMGCETNDDCPDEIIAYCENNGAYRGSLTYDCHNGECVRIGGGVI